MKADKDTPSQILNRQNIYFSTLHSQRKKQKVTVVDVVHKVSLVVWVHQEVIVVWKDHKVEQGLLDHPEK